MYYYKYSPTRFGAYCAIFRENLCRVLKIMLQYLIITQILYLNFEYMTEFLPEDGTIGAQTFREELIIIHYFVYMHFVGVLKIWLL